MNLRTLPPKLDLRGERVLVRVDWNVPIHDGTPDTTSEKIARSLPFIRELKKRGAVVFLLTHLGRPKGREQVFSTEPLAKAVSKATEFKISFLDVNLDTKKGADRFLEGVTRFSPGDVVLLENVRFQKGEETNAVALVARYAAGARLFINDAFASCHRKHASVVGLAKALKSFAGPNLVREVEGISRVLGKPKRPYVAVIGGAKLATKLPVLERFLATADAVFIGGAMAHPFFVAKHIEIGKSLLEKGSEKIAKRLLRAHRKKIVLPEDAVVAKKLAFGVPVRRTALSGIKKTEMIGDIGTETMRAWSAIIKKANTIVWNGSLGVAEIPAFSHGSRVMAVAIAERAKGKAYGMVGGGDTLPVIEKSGVGEWIDHVSTGGGAMLEFIAKKGKLPGIVVLGRGA